MANRRVTSQPEFWDLPNQIEIPIVKALQKIFMVKQFPQFHKRFQDILSTRYFSYYPLFLYSFGQTELSLKLARGIIFYALLSSLGKFTFPRKRPQRYPGIIAPEKIPSSSFPSRHSIAVAVFSSIIPWPLVKYLFVISMCINRVVTAAHFPTDTIVGIIIGYFCVYLGEIFHNPYVLSFLGIIALSIWPSASRAIGGVLPVLFVSPSFHCDPLTSIQVFVFYIIQNYYVRAILSKKNANRWLYFFIEVLMSSFITGLVTYTTDLLKQE